MNTKLNYILGVSTAALLSTSFAGEVSGITSSGSTVNYGAPKLTGSASLDLNSNFILYGQAIYGNSDDYDGQGTFNPSLSLNYQKTEALSFNAGVWLDINDNTNSSRVDVEETDVWVGAAYTSGITTYSLTFQNWQYAGESEEVLDLGFSFDTFLNPSILFHQRLGEGASGGDRGTLLVLGASHGWDLSDNWSLTVPVSVGFALTDDYYGQGADTGLAYASIGLQNSYALTDNSSFNFGVTFYTSDDEVIGNSKDEFLGWNVGYSFNF